MMIYYDFIVHSVGLYVMAIFYQDYNIKFTEACRSRMWGSLALCFSGKDFIFYPIIPVLTVIPGGRGKDEA